MSVPRPAHRSRLRIALVVISAAVVLAVVAIAVFVASLGHAYDTRRHVVDAFPPAADRPAAAAGPAAEAVNILVIGSDGMDPESPPPIGRQADAVMVLHVTADRSKVYAVSILRNSLVEVPGHGRTAIKSSYAYGGVKLAVRTVERLLGVRVDHVVDVSLQGLPALIDALGGIQVQVTAPFTTGGEEVRAGRRTLDGDRALAYLRAGDSGAPSDERRATAQEQVLRGVMQRVLSARVLLTPEALATSITALSPYLTTDRGLDSSALVRLGVSLRDLRGSDVVTLRAAARGERTVAGAALLELDGPLLQRLSEALRKDSLSTYPG